MRAIRTATLALLLGSSGAAAQVREPPVPTFDIDSLDARLAYLADDALLGRAPGARGGRLAAHGIAARFARAGLRPLQGSWLHEVPLTGWSADTAGTFLLGGAGPDALRFDQLDDVVLWAPGTAERALIEAPVVFAGYGIRAPEYGWDDYTTSVRGRVVLVLVGEPPASAARPNLFDGDALTWYGRWAYKVEEAGRQGAAAVLLIHREVAAGYGWPVVQASWGGEVLALEGDSARAPGALGWIRYEAALRLLARVGESLDQLAAQAARADFEPVELQQTVRIQLSGHARRFTSPNVVGVRPGSHPTRRGEYVAFTAHYDPYGVAAPIDGDSIFNGAYDNASGVAVLLSLADAFGALRTPPARSLLFIATTAEEAGMLGARYFVQQPVVPRRRIVAAINIDGANLWGETDDVGAIGAERSTLGEAFARAAARLGLRATAERAPEQGFFFRSDHFPFARAGIPAIAIEHGLQYRGREPGWGDGIVGAYLAQHYHARTDEYDPRFDLRGAAQQAAVAYLLGYEVAMRPARPAWYGPAPFSVEVSARGSGPARSR